MPWSIEGDTQALAVARIGLGLLLVWQAIERAQDFTRFGYFGDHFHWPWLFAAPPARVYLALLGVEMLGGLAAVLGARLGLAVSGATGIYLLLCDRLQFHHNRYSLFLFALLVAMAPCDRVWSLTARGRPRRANLWAQRLAQLQLTLIYLASGGSKLLDEDWRSGRMLLARLVRHGDEALRHGVPRWLLTVISRPEVMSAISKGAIATELGLAFLLWTPRFRAAALWWALIFHATIEGTARVERFSWLMWIVLALFARTEIRTFVLFYDPGRAGQRLLAKIVRTFDWLLRFRLEPAGRLEVVRGDGTVARGVELPGALARGLPILFPLWPLLYAGGAISLRFFPLRGRSTSSAAR